VRVLGIDPGLTRCGIGLVDGAVGRTMGLIDVAVVRTATDADLGRRLATIHDAIAAAIAKFGPDTVAIERVFSQHNTRTVMGTAQAAGVAVLAAQRAGVAVEFYTPTEVKAAVTGSGVADKAQVAAMVTRILRLTAAPKPADATDALALAITDIWRGTARRRLRALEVVVR